LRTISSANMAKTRNKVASMVTISKMSSTNDLSHRNRMSLQLTSSSATQVGSLDLGVDASSCRQPKEVQTTDLGQGRRQVHLILVEACSSM
jgi:hypothetical protein